LKITVIPLDSRPCNYSWVEKFAKIATIELAIIPIESTGTMHQGFCFEKHKKWLIENSKNSDYLIVSIDALVSGGLIQARKAMMNVEKSFEDLNVFKVIRRSNPNIKIYIFDTIMRTSITTASNITKVYWEKMNQYSKLLGDYYFSQDESIKIRLNKLEKEIPQDIIDTYLLARNKKHQINLKLCEMVNENIIDDLLLLQEDSMAGGIQRAESDILLQYVKSNGLEEKISIYNGTDEGTLVLLSKILMLNIKEKTKVHVLLSDELIKYKVMPFEDRSLQENYQKLMNVIDFENASYDESKYILAIYSEAEYNYDLNLDTTDAIIPNKNRKFKIFTSRINQAIKDGKKLVFVDLLHPNGGSIEVLSELDYHNLLGYSAWNTASNSLGSALAVIALDSYKNSDLSSFLFERIIDDCLYQTYVRREINQLLLSEGVNIYDIPLFELNRVLILIKEKLKNISKEYLNFNFKVILPWARTFEIDIDLE